jgi:hypothetical protein
MFEVGQKVWDVVRGEGRVVRVDSSLNYPVIVKFVCGGNHSYTADGKSHEAHENPSLYPYPVETVKKVTKPSINWGHVRGEYNYLAQDIDGSAWLYWEEPKLGEVGWDVALGDFALADSHVSYTPGTCDWKESLVERPEGA